MKHAPLTVAAVLAAAAIATGSFYIGRNTGPARSQGTTGTVSPAGERKVLYWHDLLAPTEI